MKLLALTMDRNWHLDMPRDTTASLENALNLDDLQQLVAPRFKIKV